MNNGVTYVCPSKDIECGTFPMHWCLTCPKRSTHPIFNPKFPEPRQVIADVKVFQEAANRVLEERVERRIAESLRLSGWTLLKTATGYEVRKLGPCVAQDAADAPAPSPVQQPDAVRMAREALIAATWALEHSCDKPSDHAKLVTTQCRAALTALSATTVQARELTDEREAFEAAMGEHFPQWSFQDDGTGGYHAHYTETAWIAWQARAALSVGAVQANQTEEERK